MASSARILQCSRSCHKRSWQGVPGVLAISGEGKPNFAAAAAHRWRAGRARPAGVVGFISYGLAWHCLVCCGMVLHCIVLYGFAWCVSLICLEPIVCQKDSGLTDTSAHVLVWALIGAPGSPTTAKMDHASVPCSYAHSSSRTAARASSRRLGCLRWLARAAESGHFSGLSQNSYWARVTPRGAL